jgi:hypothetical protein
MAIDPSIPLSVQAPKTDVGQQVAQAYTLADLINKHKADQELRAALANPNSIDPSTGMISQNTLAQITRTNPTAGMALQKNAADLAAKQATVAKDKAQTKNFNFENGIKQMDLIAQTGGSLMTQYQQLIQQGVPRDQAIAKMQPLYQEAINQVAQSGMIDQEHLAHIPPQFDPDQVAGGVFRALTTKDQFAVMHQKQQEALDQSKAQETQRHNRVEEGQGSQRIGIEAQNASTNRARLGFEESQPKSEVGKINTDLNAGRITKDQANSALIKATGGGDPATVDEVAKHIADGTMQPLTAQALRTPAGMRIMARVYELNPKYDAKDYGVQAKALKDFTTGKQGNTVRSLNVAMDHLDTLSQLGDALKNGNMQAFNKLAQGLAAQTGSAAPTNFDAAKKIVSDEVVKAIIGSGGGVGDRDEAAKAFDKASSPAQLAGAVNTAKRLMRGQLHGLEKQYKESTGRSDFNDRFLSDSARALDQSSAGTPLPGQGPAAANVNKPPIPPTTNAQGWTLHKDKNGNMAYVSPDGKQFQPVQ